MTSPTHDVAIVGAGLVGLATAYQLLTRRPGTTVAVLDKESEVGRHQSSHNSGVLHSGVYYAPGSLKARMCRQGKGAVEAFARDHGIAVDRCGKVIVAVDESELDRLNALYERGQGNGVPGLKMIGPAELRDLEPHVTGVAALHVGDTAIIDFAAVCRAYADEVVRLGGELLLGSAVRDIADTGRRVTLISDRGEVSALAAVTCAGLYSDRFGGQDAGASDRALSGRLLHPRPGGPTVGPIADLPGAGPGAAVPRCSFHPPFRRRGVGRPERGPGVRPGGLRAYHRAPE